MRQPLYVGTVSARMHSAIFAGVNGYITMYQLQGTYRTRAKGANFEIPAAGGCRGPQEESRTSPAHSQCQSGGEKAREVVPYSDQLFQESGHLVTRSDRSICHLDI